MDARTFLNQLIANDQVHIVEREVDATFELAAVVATAQRDSDRPILFRRVKGCEFPVVANLYGSSDRLRRLIGAEDSGFCQRWTEIVNAAPALDQDYAKQVAMPADLVAGRLSDLPAITWREKDAGPYLTAGVVIAKDPDTGIPNLSFSRGLMVSDNEIRCCIDIVQDLGKYQARAEARNEPLEIAWLIGAAPAVFLAACTSVAIDQDELKIAAQTLGGSIDMRPCRALDLSVPADTEIVIEARIIPGERRPEAPFGEFMGYYCKENSGFLAEVAAVSWRKDACFHGLLTGSREDLTVVHATYAARAYRNLVAELPGIIDVACHTTLHCTVVKIDKQYEGHAQHVMLKVFATNPYYNFACLVVDHDIDIDSLDDVWWAYLTRGSVDRRTMLLKDIPGGYEYTDDKLHDGRIGLDATAPLGRLAEFERTRTPGEDRVDLGDYFT